MIQRDDLKRALTNLIEIYETDDVHAVNRKETVAWLKIQLAEAEKEGWDPAEVIKALEEQRREEAAIRRDAERLLEEIRREQPEDADSTRETLNAELLEKGILPIQGQE
jgi:vacuolar-type H+-ATPase subunit I/STV1